MRTAVRLSAALEGGGYSLHRQVGRVLNLGFLGQNYVLAGLACGAILLAGLWDRSFFLPGRDVGLFEHPAIWAFVGLQVALPLTIRRSLANLVRARSTIRAFTKDERKGSEAVVEPVLQFVQLRDRASRMAATLFFGAGLVAFVWNTYQNQLPGIVVAYDFWDSNNHQAGFWITRLYKAYLFIWLLPYIALVHTAILVSVLTRIRRARTEGHLKLIPFHPDDAGGLGFVPGLITAPIITAVLLGSLVTAAAFAIHRAADVTPLMGVSVLLFSAAFAYAVPMAFLRTDIVALKKEAMRSVRALQQDYYNRIVNGASVSVATVSEGNEALEYFERLSTRIQSISNYPHLRLFAGYIGLAVTPSAVSLAFDLLRGAAPLIRSLVPTP
ncbi:MAG: hypothetical protein WC829_00435 [Hyphomicrobium sp.]|jgi:hypothetical protein